MARTPVNIVAAALLVLTAIGGQATAQQPNRTQRPFTRPIAPPGKTYRRPLEPTNVWRRNPPAKPAPKPAPRPLFDSFPKPKPGPVWTFPQGRSQRH